jgi:hypothetical protein
MRSLAVAVDTAAGIILTRARDEGVVGNAAAAVERAFRAAAMAALAGRLP